MAENAENWAIHFPASTAAIANTLRQVGRHLFARINTCIIDYLNWIKPVRIGMWSPNWQDGKYIGTYLKKVFLRCLYHRMFDSLSRSERE